MEICSFFSKSNNNKNIYIICNNILKSTKFYIFIITTKHGYLGTNKFLTYYRYESEFELNLEIWEITTCVNGNMKVNPFLFIDYKLWLWIQDTFRFICILFIDYNLWLWIQDTFRFIYIPIFLGFDCLITGDSGRGGNFFLATLPPCLFSFSSILSWLLRISCISIGNTFNMSETCFLRLKSVFLYFMIAEDLCPVCSAISWGSTPLWNNLVAHAFLKEWFWKFPSIPAWDIISCKYSAKVFFPTGQLVYHNSEPGNHLGSVWM